MHLTVHRAHLSDVLFSSTVFLNHFALIAQHLLLPLNSYFRTTQRVSKLHSLCIENEQFRMLLVYKALLICNLITWHVFQC